MKGVVFVGWSGSNDLAIEVKRKIEQKDYHCIVGGNLELTGNEVFVGGTIISQLQKSNQAIFLIEKKDTGYISNNLMFELGYALSKFTTTAKKVHLYYIDINEADEVIPSDLRGAWATHLSRSDYSKDSLSEIILDDFLNKQDILVPENKMGIVNSWYNTSHEIDIHFTNPGYSDYELAQYVLFYVQASYMFDFVETAYSKLHNLLKHVNPESHALFNAVSLALVSLELFGKTRRNGDLLYLDFIDFDEIYEKFTNIFDDVMKYDNVGSKHTDSNVLSELALWMLAIGKEHQHYACALYLSNPEIDDADLPLIRDYVISIGEEVLQLCDELINLNQTTNQEFAILLKAYVYRNLAKVYDREGNSLEMANNYYQYSFDTRKKLMDYYSKLDIDSTLIKNFEMEYYLSLSEITDKLPDGMKRRANIRRLREYINKERAELESSSYFLQQIEYRVNELNG